LVDLAVGIFDCAEALDSAFEEVALVGCREVDFEFPVTMHLTAKPSSRIDDLVLNGIDSISFSFAF
jgi:hypothetical protein